MEQKSIDKEFYDICCEILKKNLTEKEWQEIESSDMFQTANYVGGFDGTESAFCFSYYKGDGTEFWFQVTLAELLQIVDGKKTFLKIRPADS